MSNKPFRYIVFLVLPLGMLILWGSGELGFKHVQGTVAPAPHVEGVKVATVAKTVMPRKLSLSGNVVARETANVASKVMAEVKAVAVTEGMPAQAGQILVALDTGEMSAQKQLAEAAVQQVAAGIKSLDGSIEEARAAVEVAEANLANTRGRYQRSTELFKSNATDAQHQEDIQAAYDMAQARVRQARAQLESLLARKTQLEAQLEQSMAQLDLAEINMGYTQVKAPFTGIVTRKLCDVGDMANPGQPLVVMERGPYRLEVPIDEGLVSKVHVGQQINVLLEALNLPMAGKVDEVVPVVDPATRTFIVKIALADHPQVRAGMFGKAELPVGDEKVITIPDTALVRWSQFTGVYVVGQEGIARLRFVRLADQHGDVWPVLSGLEEGERIVVANVEAVKDGSRVGVEQ